MASNDASVLDRLRQPEYTGENRCTPCTIVNVSIAAAASALVWIGGLVAVVPAAALFVGSLAVIYLRGYLVPGTPTLTKRYLPNSVLALFDKHPLEEDRDEETWDTVERREREQRNAVDPERFLAEGNVVEPCEHEDDLCLTDEFADRLERHTERLREAPPDEAAIAELFGVDADALSEVDRDYPAVELESRIRKWPSDGALVADVATDRALRDQSDEWTTVPREQRAKILESLRSFRQTCPLCSGRVELGTDTVESCCSSYEVATASCLDCGETLLEFDPSKVQNETPDSGVQP